MSVILNGLSFLRGPKARARFYTSGDYLHGLPIPLPSAVTRRIPTVGGSGFTSTDTLSYDSTPRGMLINADKPYEKVYFQFNPTELTWLKNNEFFDISRVGMPTVDTVWAKGGRKTVNFTLQFDFSLGALQTTKYHTFLGRPSGVSFDELSATYNAIVLAGGLNGDKMPLNILRGWEYPNSQDKTKVKFSVNGQYLRDKDFFGAFPFLHLSYGYYYLGGIISNMQIRETLFSKELSAIKAEVVIEFTVFESTPINAGGAV